MNYKEFINELRGIGWQFAEFQNEENEDLKGDVSNKLSLTSDEFQSFIKSFSVLANQEDNIWFLSLKDYFKEPSQEGFAWNEFELQSLDNALDSNQKEEIKNFWNDHLPLMLSVKNGYAYVALVLNGENKGQIVTGNEPEYEDTVLISESLSSFFDTYISVLKNESENRQLTLFFR